MPARKVVVQLKINVTMVIHESAGDIDSSEVVDELDYHFVDTTGKATVKNFEIIDEEELSSTPV